MTEDKLPREVIVSYKRLVDAGFEAYFIGGCVRDLLLGRMVKDWDLTTNATPEELQSVFPDSFYDNTFGTVGIPYEENGEKKVLEITTYRKERDYSDKRHPKFVEWGKTLEDDVTRRDFTINTIALKLNKDKHETIDLLDGKKDLEKKLIRAVGDADKRFGEDALRLMRAVRFAAQLGFIIEEKTLVAVKRDSGLIKKVSFERIRDELLKILGSENPFEGIMLLDETGLLEQIIPELARGKGISQARPGRHHTTDVFTHNVMSLKHTPATDPIVRLATLLHDVGKPEVEGKDSDGHVIFYNHEVAGARIAREIADRFKLSKREREKIVTLIRWHMFTVDEHITDSAIRRFIRRVGVENVKDMIDLRIGDRLGGGTQVAESWRLKKFKTRLEEQLNPPFSINDLAIDGTDIMRELKLKPGPKVGEILQLLFEEVDLDLSKNDREFLIKRIKELEMTINTLD